MQMNLFLFKRLSLSLTELSKNIIESEATKEDARKKTQYFTRNRKMNFSQALCFMLGLAKTSTQSALNRFFKDSGIHMSQQAFSKLRDKFDHSPFTKLFALTATHPYNGEYEYKTLYGYRISAIDGTTLTLPNFPELLNEFGGYGPNADVPTARASVCYDVLNDVILDATIDKPAVDERTMASSHIAGLLKNSNHGKDLIIFDRGYASKDLISELISGNLNFLFRIKSGFNKQIDKLPLGIHTIEYKTNNGIELLTVIKFSLSASTVEVLLTNIPQKLSIGQYKALYFLRWPVETKYDIVKNKLEIENFTGNTKNAILQDFYATMYLSNMISVFISEANATVDRERNHNGNKHQYKANVNNAIGSFKDKFILSCLAKNKRRRIRLLNEVIAEMSSSVVPIRPDRIVPRNSHARNARFHHNHKSNC